MTLGSSPAPVIPAADRDACPATVSQLSLWFFDQLVPDSAVYNMSRTYRVQGPLDVAALGEALTRVVASHEALRTTFSAVEGRVFQVINPPWRMQPRLIDLSGTPEQTRLAGARQVAAEEADRPFDLAAGPLLRCGVIRLEPDDHLVVLAIHHIVADGRSLAVLVRDMSAAYADVRAGRPPKPHAPVLQFGDAAAWEADWLGTEAFAGQLAYWRDRLTDAPRVLAIETDRPRRDLPTFGGAQVTGRVAPEITGALRDLALSERASLYMTSLAVFTLLLGRYQRSDDVVVGVPVAGRVRPEFEDMIGMFVNTLVVRCDLTGGPTFRQALRRVRDTLLDAYAHQEVPFARLVEELNPERDLTHRPLVQVLFQYLRPGETGGDHLEFVDATVTPVDLPNRHAEADMEVQLVDNGDGLDLVWTYSTDLYAEATITAMADEFVGLLAAATQWPDRAIADFDLLTADERQRFAELERTGAQLRVIDGNLQRCPFGVPGELVMARADLATATLARPSQTAARFLPDPFSAQRGSRMYATGERAKYRRDGVIEILRPPPLTGTDGGPATGERADQAAGQPPSETELALARIWAELLEVDEIGIDDDFFSLGGHSIMAIRAIIAVREKFDCELPLRAIFDAPTVASMARLIDAGGLPEDTAA